MKILAEEYFEEGGLAVVVVVVEGSESLELILRVCGSVMLNKGVNQCSIK